MSNPHSVQGSLYTRHTVSNPHSIQGSLGARHTVSNPHSVQGSLGTRSIVPKSYCAHARPIVPSLIVHARPIVPSPIFHARPIVPSPIVHERPSVPSPTVFTQNAFAQVPLCSFKAHCTSSIVFIQGPLHKSHCVHSRTTAQGSLCSLKAHCTSPIVFLVRQIVLKSHSVQGLLYQSPIVCKAYFAKVSVFKADCAQVP